MGRAKKAKPNAAPFNLFRKLFEIKMFASVINYGSSLIFGAPEESQRVPATDGDSSSFTEKFEDSWVVIDQSGDEDCSVPVRTENTISKKSEKRRQKSSRRRIAEMTSSPKTNYSPYIKAEGHFLHNKRPKKTFSRKNFAPINQPQKRSFK